MEWNDRVVVLDHPIVQHKLAILRDKHTPSNEFRDVVRELSLFETYEATRDLPLTNVFIQTPIAPFDAKQITGRKVAFVPGDPFYADATGAPAMRLNFTNADEAAIEEGVRRLGELLREG